MLETYVGKRDFKKTAEPPAGSKALAGQGPLRFVVQKHAARRLHYDFRLEVGGVLKSWPIPKGPSLDPTEKRLAVMTEDHPLDYAVFEGLIPKGEYGGGEVIVWDAGIYAPVVDGKPCFDRAIAESVMANAIDDGKVTVRLHGRKMRGVWTLVHKRADEWLFLKRDDRDAAPNHDLLEDGTSVLSGLSIEDIRAGRLPRPEESKPLLPRPEETRGARRSAIPSSLAPMLPSLTSRAFSHPDWLFEPKLDGYRVIAIVRKGKGVRLVSRQGNDVSEKFAELAAELALQPWDDLVLDGELVALDANGAPSFQAMQNRASTPDIPLVYFAFDLLFADGFDLRPSTLDDRRNLLESLVVPSEHVRVVDCVPIEGEAFYASAVGLGFEGMVAKLRSSTYEAGRRSTAWLKVKSVKSDEFVIGGYTAGTGARGDTFGSLLLGMPTADAGKLQFAGHVGTGFDQRLLAEIRRRLDAIRTETSPFTGPIPSSGRWIRNRGAVTWVQPRLVAEVKFAERTRDGMLRAPVFLRLRDDKSARDAVHVQVIPSPDAPPEIESLDDSKDQVIAQLGEKSEKLKISIQGHELTMTNLDRVLWPAVGRSRPITKRDLAIYYAGVAPWLLPHLRDRPITLIRYPDGIGGEHFFQRHWDKALPPFVETVRLDSGDRDNPDFLLCQNLATLLWLAQMSALEVHSWYSRTTLRLSAERRLRGRSKGAPSADRALDYPDFLVFDLDPYRYSGKESAGAEPELHRAGFEQVRRVALQLKELLDGLQLHSFVKTTGRTGLHIYVPIHRTLTYRETHAASEVIAKFLAQQNPTDVTVEWSVKKRTGKVFADYNQNARGKTLASIYSPRASTQASVSVPVRWEELASGSVYPTRFTVRTVLRRLREQGDLWADILASRSDLAGRIALASDQRAS